MNNSAKNASMLLLLAVLAAAIAIFGSLTLPRKAAEAADSCKTMQAVETRARILPIQNPQTEPVIYFGVTTSGPTARDAASENRRIVNGILSSMRSEDIELRISNYSFNCNPAYDGSGNITGYTVSSSVTLNHGEPRPEPLLLRHG